MRSRRKSRSEREAGRRLRRRILFVVVAVGLLVGVQRVVDRLTSRNWTAGPDSTTALSGPALPGPDGATFGEAGVAPVPARVPQVPGAPAVDPALQAQAAELQKRYSERLSRMSNADKMRAFNKVRALFGSDPRSIPGR